MALITDKVLLNPKATGSLPGTDEGSLAYDSTTDELKLYKTSWAATSRDSRAIGEQVYGKAGTSHWPCPAHITSVSVVCIC